MDKDLIKKVWPEWEIEDKPLGKGSYGTVYKAKRSDHGLESYAAIKVISIPRDDSELDTIRAEGISEDNTKTALGNIVKDFVNEIRLMESFKGVQNIVSAEDYKVVERENEIGWDILIRMELLTPFTKYMNTHEMTEQEVAKLGVDICSALELCAKKNVIHRDIKPQNIFVNEFGDFKLGDFGIAKKLENMTGGLSQRGTYSYMAPEVEKGTDYNSSVDLYSLGIVLYSCLNKKRLPFLDTEKQIISPFDREDANRRRLSGEALPAPCMASKQMSEIILCACAYDPKDRFSSPTAMKNALLTVAGKKQVSADDTIDRTVAVRHAAAKEPIKAADSAENRTVKPAAPITPVKKPAAAPKTQPAPAKEKKPLNAKKLLIPIAVGLALLLLLAGFIALAVSRAPKKEKEPNNDYTNANDLPVNRVMKAKLDTEDGTDEDWFKVVLKKPGRIAIDFSTRKLENNSENEYWRISLKNRDDRDNNIWQTTVTGEGKEVVSPDISVEKGDYFIVVEPANDQNKSSAKYELKVEASKNKGWETEPNNDRSAANEIKTGKAVSGTIHNGDDLDRFQFELNEAAVVDIELTAELTDADKRSIIDPDCSLWKYWVYPMEDDSVFPQDDDEPCLYGSVRGRNLVNDGIATPLKDGKYCLKLSAGDIRLTCPYSIKLNTSACKGFSELEPNNSIENGNPVFCGNEYTGRLRDNNDKDFFVLDLSEEDPCLLKFDFSLTNSGGDGNLKVNIYPAAAQGQMLYEAEICNDGKKIGTGVIPVDGGEYILEISVNGADADYKFSFTKEELPQHHETEYNNTRETAEKIELGVQYSGNASWYRDSDSQDADFFSFELDSTSCIVLDFEADPGNIGASPEWTLEIFRDGENGYQWKHMAEKGKNSFEQIVLPAGRFYLKISSDDREYWSDTEYRFTVRQGDMSETMEVEENDNRIIATAMKDVDTAYFGTVNRGGDYDWYKFTLTEPAFVWAELSDLKEQSRSGFCWKLALYYGADGSEPKIMSEADGSQTSLELDRVPLKPGTYFIEVWTDMNPDDGAYTLTVHTDTDGIDEWEKELNNDVGSAEEIEPKKDHYAALQYEKDVDWFKFTIDEPSVIKLRFSRHEQSSPDNKYWNVSLLDKDGKTIGWDYYWFKGRNGDDFISPEALPAGTYTIKVTKSDKYSSDEYRLNVETLDGSDWETESNDSFETANDIEIGKQYSGQLYRKDKYDRDLFCFVLEEESAVRVSFSVHESIKEDSHLYFYIALYNEQGESVWEQRIAGTDGDYESDIVTLPAGTYYFLVMQSDKYTDGNYKFTINAL